MEKSPGAVGVRAGIRTLREVDAAGHEGVYRLPPDSPIRRLIVAVLQVAVEDARTGGPRTGMSTRQEGLLAKRRRMAKAREWITSDKHDDLFDFNRLCEELDIDPQQVKRRERATWGAMPEECERGTRVHVVRDVSRKMGQ